MRSSSLHRGESTIEIDRDPTFWEVFNDRFPDSKHVAEKPESPSSWRVYFLHFPELRRVKIGYSRDVTKRRRIIAQKRYGPCVLLGVLNGGRSVEKLMHERFASDRIDGEWFDDRIIEDAEALIRADRDYFGLGVL